MGKSKYKKQKKKNFREKEHHLRMWFKLKYPKVTSDVREKNISHIRILRLIRNKYKYK